MTTVLPGQLSLLLEDVPPQLTQGQLSAVCIVCGAAVEGVQLGWTVAYVHQPCSPPRCNAVAWWGSVAEISGLECTDD